MEAKVITNLYSDYKRCQHKSMSIEDDFFSGVSKKEWLTKLQNKSKYLREAYQNNEKEFKEDIYPFINGEMELDETLANTFFKEIEKMVMNVEDDYLLTTSMLIVLEKYYTEHFNLDKLILTKFFLGLSYADRAEISYCIKAVKCFDEVCAFKNEYTKIDDFDVRRRIIFAFYNRIANFHSKTMEDVEKSFALIEEAIAFYKREDVNKLDGDKIDFAQMIEESIRSFLIEVCNLDIDLPNETIQKVLDIYVPKDINFKNYLDKNSIEVLAYIWCNYKLKNITINKALDYLYSFYKNKDKLVVYSDPNFYEQEEYQTQILFMSKCFKWIADNNCTSRHKNAIRKELIANFKSLYSSVPYLANNSLLNIDMIDILTNLLKSVKNENEAVEYINEIIVRRNIMTLIHSIMVSKISILITKAVIRDAPSLFYKLLETKDVAYVAKKEKYLVDYIKKASYIHDLGKSWISDIINLQDRKITYEEFLQIKTHPENGAAIIKGTILEDKYKDIILGHHKYYDNSAGYPESFDNSKTRDKILIDILTIADCIDAATDYLGRNYTTGKEWNPTVINELVNDKKRYNPKIAEVIVNDTKLKTDIGKLVSVGRINVYFDIFNKYLKNPS